MKPSDNDGRPRGAFAALKQLRNGLDALEAEILVAWMEQHARLQHHDDRLAEIEHALEQHNGLESVRRRLRRIEDRVFRRPRGGGGDAR